MRIRGQTAHRHLPAVVIMLVVLVGAEVVWRYGFMLPLTAQQFRGPFSPLLALAGILCATGIPLRCQHLRWSAVFGLVIGASTLVVPILVDMMAGSVMAGLRPSTFLALLTLGGVGAPVGAAVVVTWVFVYRNVFRKILTQDGTLCPTCAYCISNLPSDVCPECGRRIESAQLPVGKGGVGLGKFVNWSKHFLMVASSLFIAVIIAARIVQHTPPIYALFDGRYWKHALSRSESDQLLNKWLAVSMVEERSKLQLVTQSEVRSILGNPDLVLQLNGEAHYLYFDKHPVSKNMGEIYLDFKGAALSSVGYNVSGVNDLSKWSRYE